MARLLSPDQLGLFGITLLMLTMLDVFTQTSFEQALIQKKGDISVELNSVWTVQAIRGAGLALVLFLAAPLIAEFFRDLRVLGPMRVMSLSFLMEGLANVGTLWFQRDLDFRRQFAYVIGADVAAFFAVLGSALILENMWALVLGQLVRAGSSTVLSFALHPYRPRFQLEWPRMQRLGSFSRWVTGNRIVTYLATEGDDILLGRLLGAGVLGLYQVAFRISNLVSTEVTQVLDQVTFPAFSRVQDELIRLRRAYMVSLEATAILIFPISAGLLLLAGDFVQFLLGADWMPMVPAMQVLAVSGLFRALALSSASLTRAVGRPQIPFWMNLARLAAMGAVIYPLTLHQGMVGTALSVLVGVVVMLPIWWVSSTQVLGGQRLERLAKILPAVAGTVLMLLALRLVSAGGIDRPGARLLVGAAVGTATYAAFHLLLWIRWKAGAWRLLSILYQGRRFGDTGLDREMARGT